MTMEELSKSVEGEDDSNEDQTSDELNKDASNDEEEPDEENTDDEGEDGSEGEEDDTGDTKPELKYTEESYQYALDKEKKNWQSSKDKEFKDMRGENKTLKEQNIELQSKLDEIASQDAFSYLKEDQGDTDKAEKFKVDAQRILNRWKELKPLEELKKDIDNLIPGLESREKKVQASDLAYQYFPEVETSALNEAIKILKKESDNSDLVDKLQAAVTSAKARADFRKELEESESESSKDMTLLARARSSEIKATTSKKVTHKPAASRQAGGGTDISKLSASELIERGVKKK